MKCTSCLDNYYPKEEDINKYEFNCYSEDLTDNGYCLSDNHIWKKCNEACKTCSSSSNNEHNTQCIECNTDYLKVSNNTSQCYKNNRTDLPMFINNNQWEYCDTSCLTCKNNNTTCISCNNGYYQLEEDILKEPFNCYNDTTKPPNTFLIKTSPPTYKNAIKHVENVIQQIILVFTPNVQNVLIIIVNVLVKIKPIINNVISAMKL